MYVHKTLKDEMMATLRTVSPITGIEYDWDENPDVPMIGRTHRFAESKANAILEQINVEYPSGDINFFYGGSHHFGYATDRSDIDLFMYVPEHLMLGVLHKLQMLGFNVNRRPYHNTGKYHLFLNAKAVYESYYYDDSLTPSKDPKICYANEKIIDIVIFDDADEFDTLHQDHYRLEQYLEANPEVIKMIRVFKEKMGYINGGDIFRSLLGLTKVWENTKDFIPTSEGSED